MRQPKLLQPSPTTETSSDPTLRVCISENATAGMNGNNLSRKVRDRETRALPGSPRSAIRTNKL
jgi:hypothetical protein